MTRVAAAIIKRHGKYLICRRGEGGSCAGLWEFPGGKAEPGESPEDCLVRECREELGAEIRPLSVFAETAYAYPDREIAFTFLLAEIASGAIAPAVHPEVRWARPEELGRYPFCPADVEVVERLMNEARQTQV